jgi:hypothetical protein
MNALFKNHIGLLHFLDMFSERGFCLPEIMDQLLHFSRIRIRPGNLMLLIYLDRKASCDVGEGFDGSGNPAAQDECKRHE